MVVKVMREAQLINYLRGELAISNSAIAVALRYTEQDVSRLPMVLWQYGLVTLKQLDLIFDWLEAQPT
jgi:DNA-binding MarR family transcriptional regulator